SDQVCHERERLSPTRDRVQQSVFVGTSRVYLSHEASLRVKDALQCVSLHRSVELATNNLTGLSGLRNRPRITVHRVCPLDEVVDERVLEEHPLQAEDTVQQERGSLCLHRRTARLRRLDRLVEKDGSVVYRVLPEHVLDDWHATECISEALEEIRWVARIK